MNAEIKEKIDKEYQRKITSIAFMDTPGTILMGLGLYGKFAAQGNAFHPLLNKPDVVNACLLIGGLIMAWGGVSVFKAMQSRKKQLAKLERQNVVS